MLKENLADVEAKIVKACENSEPPKRRCNAYRSQQNKTGGNLKRCLRPWRSRVW